MESDDSAPEDVPISSQPLDAMFSKRLTAKKIQRDKKLKSVNKQQKKSSTKLEPLPQDVLENLSSKIPKIKVSKVENKITQGKKKIKQNKLKGIESSEISEEISNKLPEFIPLDNLNVKCSTNFKVGIINSIIKNPTKKNYKEYKLHHSKNARSTNNKNVKNEFIKRTLMRRIAKK